MVAVRQIKTYSFLIILFLFLNLYEVAEGATMSLFSKQENKVVIFSPLQGIITFKGKPAAGAKVERWLKWKDDVGENDSVTTDEKGRFKFSAIEDLINISPLVQFTAHQKLYVVYREERYQIWVMGKMEKDIYSELGGVPENFRCELGAPLRRIETDGGLLGTSCEWDKINMESE